MPEPIHEILDVRNDLSEVERANDVLRELWVRHQLPEDLEAPVAICVEEVLSNVIRHGSFPGFEPDIQVHYRIAEGPLGSIEVEVSDNAKAFDPLSLPPPDLSVSLEQHRAGGLGVFMLRKMMDEVRYEYREGRNRVVFRKNWQTPPAG